MSVTLQRESTEFVYVGVTGDVPSGSVEVAFLTADVRPTSGDWETAIKVDDEQHGLWGDAESSAASGEWYAAILVGDYGAEGVVLAEGDYQVWVRFTDADERPVRIAPTTLVIA